MQQDQDIIAADVRRALNTWQRRQFQYGDSDCCSFVAHILTNLTGRDYSSLVTYKNQQEADFIIESYGGFENLIDDILGEPGKPNNGDPVMVKLPVIGKAMGIKLNDSVVCVTKKGLGQFPSRYIIRGWSVCHRQS